MPAFVVCLYVSSSAAVSISIPLCLSFSVAVRWSVYPYVCLCCRIVVRASGPLAYPAFLYFKWAVALLICLSSNIRQLRTGSSFKRDREKTRSYNLSFCFEVLEEATENWSVYRSWLSSVQEFSRCVKWFRKFQDKLDAFRPDSWLHLRITQQSANWIWLEPQS